MILGTCLPSSTITIRHMSNLRQHEQQENRRELRNDCQNDDFILPWTHTRYCSSRTTHFQEHFVMLVRVSPFC